MAKRCWVRNEAQGTVAQCLPREPQYFHLGLLVQALFCSRVATPRVALSFTLHQDNNARRGTVGPGDHRVPSAKLEMAEGEAGWEQGQKCRAGEAAFKSWQWQEGRKDRTQGLKGRS